MGSQYSFWKILTGAILLVLAQECKCRKDCKKIADDCPSGYVEIYTDEGNGEQVDYSSYYDGGNPINGVERLCCPSNSPGLDRQKKRARGCKLTQCFAHGASGSAEDEICTSLPTRTVDGQVMQYDPIDRTEDECLHVTSGAYGEPGVRAMCCPRNSEEGMLTMVLGAEHHQFPHYVYLYLTSASGETATCGGTIYNEWFIVTAAHCVMDAGAKGDPTQSYAFVDVRFSNTDNANTRVPIEDFIVHPESSRRTSNSGMPENDIALIKLSSPIPFSDNVKALPLAKPNFNPFLYSNEAIIIGVGTTDSTTETGLLQKARTTLRDLDINAQNQIMWGSSYKEMEAGTVLFVGGKINGTSAMVPGKGDSGGPLICKDENGKAILCGVASTGFNLDRCEATLSEQDCRPATYMAIQRYNEWIRKVAGSQRKAKIFREYMYGAPVPSDKYEHQVHITSSAGPSCGGTLIEKNLVVTAAHCVADSNGITNDGLQVFHGIRDLKSDQGTTYSVTGVKLLNNSQDSNAGVRRKRIIKFDVKPTPKYPYYRNDLALLRLSSEVNIRSSKLPKIDSAPASNGDTGKVTWTTAISFPMDTTSSGKMQQRSYQILEKRACQKRMDRAAYANVNIKVDDNIMCGVEKYNGGAQCDRELGGGLIYKSYDGKDVLCGVQVFRFCQLALPDAFLDISQHKDWINTNKALI